MSVETALATPEPTPLEVLRAALAKAWASRPAAEREAFLEAFDSAPEGSAPTGSQSAAVLEVEKVAAASGAIAPPVLSQLGRALGLPSVDLDALAPRFDRFIREGRWWWTLRTERRFLALSAIAQETETHRRQWLRRLNEALMPGPEAEILLRSLVGERAPAPADLARHLATAPPCTAEAWAQALSWARSSAFDPEPLLAVAKRRIAIHAALKGYDHLLREGFYGRETEIDAIGRFLDAAKTGKRIPILSIDGIGGAGKSTLLAAALHPHLAASLRDATGGPMIIMIDFDRRLLVEGGELELSFELSRQIGLYVPELDEGLTRLRLRARRLQARLDRTSSQEVARDATDRRGQEFNEQMASLLKRRGEPSRDLILVLDTFEEWERQGGGLDPNGPLARVMDWINQIKLQLGLSVGVIVSGRTPRTLKGFEFWDRMTLGDLPQADAKAFLRGLKTPPRAAGKIHRAVGGNPLVLKLAAHYYASLPPGRRKDFLDDEAEALGDVDRKLVLGVLYQRFLNHIADPSARRLAHPGLALRQVTPVLIQEVLGQPCGLGEVSDREAKRLFKLLGDEVWLVERRGEALYHRPQIRAAMLQYMRQDHEQADRVRAVHQQAHTWWLSQRGEAAALEATYHRLALMRRGELLDFSAYPSEHLARLTANFDDFEPGVAAQARMALGLPLSEAQASALPPPRRSQWANAKAQGLTARGSPVSALRLWRRQGGRAPAEAWRCQAAFQGLAWDDWIFDPPDQQPLRLKYHVLLTHVSPDEGVFAARRDRLASWLHEPRRELFGQKIDDTQIENAYFLSLLFPEARDMLAISQYGALGGSITAIDWWRWRALGGAAPFEADLHVVKVLNGAFRPSRPWLHAVAGRLTAHGFSPDALMRFIQDFEANMANPRSDLANSTSLLGHWANRFAETLFRTCQGQRHDMADALRLLPADPGLDPEWRLPLRLAFARTFKDSLSLGVFSDALARALDVTPRDFVLKALYKRQGETWRWPWSRVIELVDRAGALPHLLRDPAVCGHHALRPICEAYLAWYELRQNRVMLTQTHPRS